MNEQNILIFSGPSGVGKNTVSKYFLNDSELNIYPSISATTRKKRKEETNGKEYYFLTVEEFQTKINNNEFVEWAKYVDNYYGTLKSEIIDKINNNRMVYLEIEIIGVKNILKIFPNATTIFLSPPSIEELEKRLISRKTETKDIIKKRISKAKEEISQKDLFKYVVINDEPERAAEEIKNIIKRVKTNSEM